MRLKKILLLFSLLLFIGCSPLRTPVVINHSSIKAYKYVYITPTTELVSSVGGVYGTYGSTISNTVNPSDVIAGEFIKEGYIIIPELKPDLADETMIINYGESGRRNRGFGYTIEVTMQIISARTHDVISVCTAEGQGSTEADDIKQAIRRALVALFNNVE